ncbi:phosphate ABC transporter, permease protein PstA, partial [Candidatus Poribacteria bacterium]|nr:phosphate ABC transporter, permease protein PstA [Candidatus Poribacteria bacterium]
MSPSAWRETFAFWLMRVVAYVIVATVGWIILDIVSGGWRHVDWQFVSTFPRRGGSAGGILP